MAKDLQVHKLREFPQLSQDKTSRKRVRIVRYNDDPTPRLDIWGYVEAKSFTGWGRGVSLTLAEVQALMRVLPEIERALIAATPRCGRRARPCSTACTSTWRAPGGTTRRRVWS